MNGVDLDVKRGEFFGLLGPNGAGKTTLIKVLCGIILPDGGEAFVNGYDVVRERDKVKASVSFVAGGRWIGFDYALSMRENLHLFGLLSGLSSTEARARTRESLDLVGLTDKADERIETLSSGMRQRALVARGLVVETPIFFLDEPTVGIDPEGAHEIRRFIKEELNEKKGQTVFLTTHYTDEAEMLCDRIALINKGKIVACGTKEELCELIQRRESIEVTAIGLVNALEEKIRSLDHVDSLKLEIDEPVTGRGRIRVTTREPEELTQKLMTVLNSFNVKILGVDTSKTRLEDVFLEFLS